LANKEAVSCFTEAELQLAIMVCYLILESQNEKFKPFIDIMPKTFGEFPIMYTEDELKWIEGSNLHDHILSVKQTYRKHYSALSTAVPELAEMCSFDQFLEFKMCV